MKSVRISPGIGPFGGVQRWQRLNGNGWAFVEAMAFFPDSRGLADPDVDVDSDYRQLHAGLFYTGRRATLQPYAGASAGWLISSLSLERRGASATADRAKFFAQVLAGMRLPRSQFTPYVEARRMFDELRPWIFAVGVDAVLR